MVPDVAADLDDTDNITMDDLMEGSDEDLDVEEFLLVEDDTQ